MPTTVPQKEFLFACLAATLHGDDAAHHLADIRPDSWQNMASLAEYHSVAPLVYGEIQKHDIDIPESLRQQFRALVLRHRLANTIRFRCMAEIAALLASHDIDLIVLKGAALAHLVYDEVHLRPMRDLDLLLPPDRVMQAADLLQGLGYEMPHGLHRYNHRPHHLPGLENKVDGLLVSVELHHDVIHRDSRCSMTMTDLREAPQVFTCGGQRLQALSHTDMLRHLCVHSFAPARELRMIHLYDIMIYAAKFADQINWTLLRTEYPYVINGIRCIHFLLPCPEAVARQVDPPQCVAPPGSGEAMLPLSKILAPGKSWSRIGKELFCPAPWWKHAYYGIRPENSLLRCHLLTHPAQLCRWFVLRGISALHSTRRVLSI